MKGKQAFYRSFLILALCTVGYFYSQSEHVYRPVDKEAITTFNEGVQVGQRAVPFSLTTLKGQVVDLSSLRGQPVILHFFATWCPVCQDEMPSLVKLDKEYRQKGGQFLAINLTNQESSIKDVRAFVQHYRAEFDPLLDTDGEVMETYQVIGIPTTLILDEEGTIVKRYNGVLTEEIIDEIMDIH
ncbi:TlpA disulfide reductase family protein [Halalkalibacterium halodurans]|jgi:peroxiredoxin|uniref:Alkyl hydroperoxide reductase n=1 Tax=Halalkalibacterium halodurans TaxID=86665 RepID=A0A0M0KHP9_ALKHA|nr:TlpA disulfide reductase family protein [Halalkalibacterium halodurans]MED4163271.1 TlpA disulfide reductase family protein [Halalkalibacterium halodurans]TPE66130.1 TlpA family protein disulfide reductase [Halalkalibacterium halodurans]